MSTNAIAESIANQFGLPEAPTLLARHAAAMPISFTRLRNNGEFHGRTMTVSPDEAFSFQVALSPMAQGDLWIGGKHSPLSASPGDTFIFDLAASTVARLPPPYDYLRIRIATDTLSDMAYERGLPRVGGLRTARIGNRDPVMYGLALAVLPIFQQSTRPPALFLDSVGLAFHAHALYTYGGLPADFGSVNPGLAPWQLQRAYDYIDAHLHGDPSISDLANECRLSASHFARAFRQSSGVPPHRWLLRRRIERAKQLMLEGDLGLAQIALACGFVDQSHLTRVFTRSEGRSPARWRRLRSN